KLATGASVEGGIKGSISGSGSTGSTDTVGQSGRHSSDSRHDISSQAAKDFREASDYLVSHKTNTSGNITDNNASSRVDQFAASLSSAKNSYDQYTTSRTRSHEYSEMASRTESLTGQMSENLTQQFANFVQHRAPQDAEAILTNTSSPEIAAQREMLAREFVKAQVEPRIDSSFEQGRNDIGNGMASVSGTPGDQTVVSDFGKHSGDIESMSRNSGIKENVRNQVDSMVEDNTRINNAGKINIKEQGEGIKQQNADFEMLHKKEGNDFNERYNKELNGQVNNPLSNTTEEFRKKAEESARKMDGKLP
ncbi:TPA: conjugal transfer protein TraG, partial [Klebsiella pneumoniae]